MADNWDSDDFEPQPPTAAKEPVKTQWDDEDKEEELVKESWEEEDKPQAASDIAAKPKAPKKKKAAGADATAAPSAGAEQSEVLADPQAEKLRQQRLVEESDFKSTKELFGDTKSVKSVDDFIPKTEAEFIEYAELLASKMTAFSKSFHYMAMLKAFVRKASASLAAADAKELNAVTTIVANEKLKAEKEATAGKKKAGMKKKQLNVEKVEEDDYRNTYGGVADEDYDFM
eukprot:TRINITY_DN1434_c0_g1_i1.p1 TRINITY_DN1434_c0_g1~~TRINITY_DN1434_c0_g1_i1.p1  ORF type:complete len:230 (+),score=59.39 TRINITY_DN1434_c0_g1_i1:374-1063(+)